MASDYQGETIQVFVFFRGKFLGYQCFGQDRLTVGGAPGMDLPLPDCPVEEGYWDVYVSRGALYAWFRSPAGGNGKVGHEDPRKVQPLDSFSLGEYRLQAKVLEGEGFLQPSPEAEEDLPEVEEDSAEVEEDSAEVEEDSVEAAEGLIEEEEEEQEASSFVDLDDEDGSEQKPAAEASDEVEGISLDYARSIWKGAEDAGRAALAEEDLEEEPEEAISLEADDEAQAEPVSGSDVDSAKDFLALSSESDSVAQTDEVDAEEEEEEDSAMEEIEEWIGFGLQEEDRIEEESPLTDSETPKQGATAAEVEEEEDLVTLAEEEPPDAAMEMESAEEPESLQALVPPGTGTEKETPVELPPARESGGLVAVMSQEERTSFWDEMTREVSADENAVEEKEEEPDEAPVEASAEAPPAEEAPVEVSEEPPPAEEEVIFEEEPTRTGEPMFASERLEGANAALAMDEAQADEDAEAEEAWDFEDEEEDEDRTGHHLLLPGQGSLSEPSPAVEGAPRGSQGAGGRAVPRKRCPGCRIS